MLNDSTDNKGFRWRTSAAQPDGSAGVPRRTVVKGIAWSVPIVAASTAVPLASASAVGCFSASTVSISMSVEPVAPTVPPTSTSPRVDGHTGTRYYYQVGADYTIPGGLYVDSVVTVCNTGTVSVDPTTLLVTTAGTNWADWVQVGDMTVTISGPSGTRSAVVTGTPLNTSSHPVGRTSWNLGSATTLGNVAPGECITFAWTLEATAVTSSPNPQSGYPNGRAYVDATGSTGYFYPQLTLGCGSYSTNINAGDYDTNYFRFIK